MVRRWKLLAVAALGVAGLFFAAKTWGPLVGKTPFRSLKTRIAERTTGGAATGAKLFAVEDWPAWRGPRGDGISRETGIAQSWPAAGLKEVWSADVGLGYSSPVAAGGRIYLFSLDNKRETLTCFDAASGHILWNNASDAGWTGDFPGTRATPAIAGNAVYTLGGAGDLTRRDLATGNPIWAISVVQATGAAPLGYGCGSSPLVAAGKVFVQGGQPAPDASPVPVAVAVDAETGKIAWTSEARGAGSYAHPILADVPVDGGTTVPQLVVFAGSALIGMDPATGRTIWSEPWATRYDVNSSTPVYSPADGHLFVTSSYGMGCMILQLSASGAAVTLKSKAVKSKFQQTILDRGVLYANNAGRLTCLSWPDGGLKWMSEGQVQLGENGSLVRVGDNLLVMSDGGTLSLVHAMPEGFKVLSVYAKALEGPEIWATPLLYGGRAFVKGTKELICYDLSRGGR